MLAAYSTRSNIDILGSHPEKRFYLDFIRIKENKEKNKVKSKKLKSTCDIIDVSYLNFFFYFLLYFLLLYLHYIILYYYILYY